MYKCIVREERSDKNRTDLMQNKSFDNLYRIFASMFLATKN